MIQVAGLAMMPDYEMYWVWNHEMVPSQPDSLSWVQTTSGSVGEIYYDGQDWCLVLARRDQVCLRLLLLWNQTGTLRYAVICHGSNTQWYVKNGRAQIWNCPPQHPMPISFISRLMNGSIEKTIEQASQVVSHAPCLPKCDCHLQDGTAVRVMTQMPKNQVNTHYHTSLHITAYITIIALSILARILDNQKWFQAHLQNNWGKGSCDCLASHLHPWEAACSSGWRYWTIHFSYSSCCHNGTHSTKHDLTSADSSRGAGDCCPMYFMNSWALGWSSDPWSAIKCSGWQSDICYNTLLHIIPYYYIDHYYVLLCSLFLHNYYIIITHYYIGYYYVSLQIHYYIS